MTTVRHILAEKGHPLYAVRPEASLREALELMQEKDIGAVLVMEDDHVEGIFSERDYARRGVLMGRDIDTAVSLLMTRVVFGVDIDSSTDEVMQLMTDKRIRHLPVVENGKVIGVISIGDVVRDIIQDQKSLISGLENYILGTEHSL
jgi:CBS domain-containing protein